MIPGMSDEQRTTLERHVQTITIAVAIALMGWVGMSVADSRESIARLEVQIEGLHSVIDRMQRAQSAGFSRREAEASHAELGRRIDRVENRVDELESEVRK